jgi:uncharacterized membrane protein
MRDTTTIARRPWHLWAVGVLSLLWNAGGAMDYVMTKTHNAAYLAKMAPDRLAWLPHIPLGMNISWVAGVWGAVLGSVLLIAASRWAVTAFDVSLAGLVVTTFYQFGLSDAPASGKTHGAMMFTAVLFCGAILLLWYATAMRRRGVLR